MHGLGKYIRLLLFEKSMSAKELAAELNISVQQMHFILSDQSLSTVSMLDKLSEILDTPSDFFLQDFDKRFLIYAIDDYFSMIDKNKIYDLQNELGFILDCEGQGS